MDYDARLDAGYLQERRRSGMPENSLDTGRTVSWSVLSGGCLAIAR